MAQNSNKYGYIVRKMPFAQGALANVLQHDLFATRVDSLISQHAEISVEVLYKIMEELYFPLCLEGVRSAEANALRKAIKSFSKGLYGDTQAWRKDYDEYLLTTPEIWGETSPAENQAENTEK